ncbi:MAG: hypothetical protein KTR31_19240 [Myxococcales bacterium]|nr:hypothetical protein [Myxococcales bacterium]
MFDDFMILGGAGLVGLQVCRRILTDMQPKKIVVASLFEAEADKAVATLRGEFGDGVSFLPAWGNLFVPTDLAMVPRAEMLSDSATRRRMLQWLYGTFEAAYEQNHLVRLIATHRPHVVVDCVNTATGLSYQNVFDGAKKVMDWMGAPDESFPAEGVEDLEHFLLSQSVPQLIRHVRFVHRATSENNTRVYVKVGTTGTGGMGLNIPYTHSEDKPSKVLLAKTEAAFGHTGLLFLLARTPNAPIVKEVKPAAMIGYRGVRTIQVSDRHGNTKIFEPQVMRVEGALELRDQPERYASVGDLVLSVVDTGENGLFTRGEFAAITALGQMEYITPEEIARVVAHEIRGANTGQDVISAIDSAVLNPSYKAGLVREAALHDLVQAEAASGLPSIALGRLGPPELSKLLFEAQLLKEKYGSLRATLQGDYGPRTAVEVSTGMVSQLAQSKVRTLAPSIGIPILSADGASLLRGPRVNVPEVSGHSTTVPLGDVDRVDAWAKKGWIDLRPANVAVWLERLNRMSATRVELRDTGSAAANIRTYVPASFEIGEVVAWIFNNEMGGHRIK